MGGGHFKTPKELEERGKTVRGGSGPSEDQKKVCQALQEVADQIGSGTHLAHGEFLGAFLAQSRLKSSRHGLG